MKIFPCTKKVVLPLIALIFSNPVYAQDGIKGVVNLGSKGWLFQTEELTGFDANALPEFTNKLAFFSDYLSKSGTKVVYVIIPTKYELYSKFEFNHSKLVENSYERIIESLRKANLTVLDAKEVLVKAIKKGDLVWMRRDTHMSPQGGQILGKSIANYLIANDFINVTHKVKYNISFSSMQFPSDLWRFIYPKDQAKYPKFENIIIPEIKFDKKPSDILGDFSPEVIMIGTSYSVKPSNAITVGIEQVLGNEILNLGRDGGGIWGSMDYYLGEKERNLVPASPKVIIWEIPERIINEMSINTYHNFPNVEKAFTVK